MNFLKDFLMMFVVAGSIIGIVALWIMGIALVADHSGHVVGWCLMLGMPVVVLSLVYAADENGLL